MSCRLGLSSCRASLGIAAIVSVLLVAAAADLQARQGLNDSLLTIQKAVVTRLPEMKGPQRIVNMHVVVPDLRKGPMAFSIGNIDGAMKSFLRDNLDFFQVVPDNVRLVSAAQHGQIWRVLYQQQYNGLPVDGATVGFTITSEGEVSSYASSYVSDLKVPTEPRVTQARAVGIAKDTLGGDFAKAAVEKESKLLIYRIGKGRDATYYLAWKFLLSGKRPNPEKDTYFIVDAVSGRILRMYLARFPGANPHGKVRGEIYPVNPTSTVTTVAMPDQYVRIVGNGTATSNAQGGWSISLPWYLQFLPACSVQYRLEGPYAHVMDNAGANFTHVQTCMMSSSCDFTWTATDRDHINVFYHLNWYHDWLVNHLSYNWVNPWDGSHQFNAEVNFSFNNSYAGDPMQFGADDFARSSDVIYHESTHNVLYGLYGDYVGWPNATSEAYAFDEGFADYFACSANDDAHFGEGYGDTRTLDNTRLYSSKAAYNTEGHTGGTIIAGAAWDFRTRMIDLMGHDAGIAYADQVVFEALENMATFPRDYYFADPQESNFLTALYLALDDNNDLSDGFPHFYDVQRAFANHNLLQAELIDLNSYDVSMNSIGWVTGGDFYITGGSFWANNSNQRGVVDLGDIGTTSLDDASIPFTGYTRFGVASAVGHTYVSLAQHGEEGGYIVFKVTAMSADKKEITIQYRYRALLRIDPQPLCKRFPQLCRVIYPCDRYPNLCADHIIDRLKDALIITLQTPDERFPLPFEKICQYVVNCPGCGSTGLCPGYRMHFNDLPPYFDVAIYNNLGRKVSNVLSVAGGTTLEFRTRQGEKYFVVLNAKNATQIGKPVKLPIVVEAMPQ